MPHPSQFSKPGVKGKEKKKKKDRQIKFYQKNYSELQHRIDFSKLIYQRLKPCQTFMTLDRNM